MAMRLKPIANDRAGLVTRKPRDAFGRIGINPRSIKVSNSLDHEVDLWLIISYSSKEQPHLEFGIGAKKNY